MTLRVSHKAKGEITMQSILKELWYGNVTPGENRTLTKTEKELAGHVANHYDYLTASLTGKHKEVFEKYEECYSELRDIEETETFIYAFQLGARIAIEVMSLDVTCD